MLNGIRSTPHSNSVPIGTNGLGRETINQLAAHNPARIFFTGRNATAAEGTISAVRERAPAVQVSFLECDHKRLASVQAAAREFAKQSDRLDALICNAGIMFVPPETTADGFEVQFGVNHVAHALWAKLLAPTLRKTQNARIVLLTSLGFELAPPPKYIDFATLRSKQDYFWFAGSWRRYGQSKLANILYAQALAKREPNITSVAVHPGVINTGLISDLGLIKRGLVNLFTIGDQVTPREGACPACWGSTAPTGVESGGFFVPVGVKGPATKYNTDEKLSDELWQWTEEALAEYTL